MEYRVPVYATLRPLIQNRAQTAAMWHTGSKNDKALVIT